MVFTRIAAAAAAAAVRGFDGKTQPYFSLPRLQAKLILTTEDSWAGFWLLMLSRRQPGDSWFDAVEAQSTALLRVATNLTGDGSNGSTAGHCKSGVETP